MVFWCPVPLALHSSPATTFAGTIQPYANLGRFHSKRSAPAWNASTTPPGSLCAYDWTLIVRPIEDSLWVIQRFTVGLPVSVFLAMTRTFLRLNSC